MDAIDGVERTIITPVMSRLQDAFAPARPRGLGQLHPRAGFAKVLITQGVGGDVV